MTDANARSWDHEVDLLIVGTGAGAMTAALAAYDRGGNVLLIEKSKQYGGSSAMSGGGLWVPGNHLMSTVGIDDNPEDAWTYLKACVGDRVPDERLRAYLEYAPQTVKYLVEHTHVKFESLPEYADYYQLNPGARPGGRALDTMRFDGRLLGEQELLNLRDQPAQAQVAGRIAMTIFEARALLTRTRGWFGILMKLAAGYFSDIPWRFKSKRDRSLTMGNALIGRLRRSLLDRGIPIWLETGAKELIVENGRVVGIVAEQKGKPLRIRAKRGVILAAGGFEGNQAMREKYLPLPTDTSWSSANPANTGDAIQMGLALGAAIDLMDDAWWGPATVVPGEDRARFMVIEKSLPGSIFVNKRGQRFVNEAAPYIDVVNSMYADDKKGNGCVPAYLIFDADYRYKYPCGPFLQGQAQPDWLLPKHLKQGYLKKADTIEGLARMLGVDPKGLTDTIAKFNGYARAGKDPDFHRGETVFDLYYGDPNTKPNPCLGEIAKPPFYGIEAFPGELGTKGGLVTDARARVLKESGEVIPGLYAIGNCSASVMGNTYPGPGATLGPATTFGFVAAHDAIPKPE